MKKKKVAVLKPNNIWDSELIKISNDYNNYYFEIGKEVTMDLAEAVAILMRMNYKSNEEIWNLKVNTINLYEIEPSRCLYWLSGGDDEWSNGNNYKKEWVDVYLDFQEEFGVIVLSILKKSETLDDIRNGFIKHLNLPRLYDFAISKQIV